MTPDPAGRRTRWAVVGTGGIVRATLPDLRLTENVEVAAVVSRTRAGAEAFAAEWGIARAYSDYAEMLADPDIDVVYIGTPHGTHFGLTAQAIAAGKHVLCEKAFTVDAAQARELAALARAAGVFVMEAMWMKFSPAVRRMHEIVAAGAIGEVRSVQAAFGFPSTEESAGRLWAPELGGGALLDVGIYPITLAREFLGQPVEVVARGEIRENGVDASAFMTLTSAGGGVAQLATSITTALAQGASVGGTDGVIELDAPFWASAGLTVTRGMGEGHPVSERIELATEGAGYVPMFRAVSEAVLTGRIEHDRHTLDDTVAVLDTIDRVRELLMAQRPGA